MVTRIGGNRRKTRTKFRKPLRQRGKISLRKYLQQFKVGEHVTLIAEPAVHEGIYFRRFHGKAGVILGKKGGCYNVKIQDFDKEKQVIVHPVHLQRRA